MQGTPNKIGRFSVGKSIALQQWTGKSSIIKNHNLCITKNWSKFFDKVQASIELQA